MTFALSFQPPRRLLLGPGPSNVEDRVSRALAAPVVGYFDPSLPTAMAEIQRLLQPVMGTAGKAFPLSGTGSAGMEAAFINLIEPGDPVAIGVAGFFGDRMRQVVERAGGRPVLLHAEWGRPIEPDQVAEALQRDPNIRVVGLVQGETSTGVLQPLVEIGQIVRAHDAFLVADAVTTVGGHPVGVDANQIDVCYAGTQKALGAPPGLSPIACSRRALDRMQKRTRPVQSFYLDLALFAEYWGTHNFYHHTPPVSFYYALLEALRVIDEEGLAERFARHRRNHHALVAGIEAMGLTMHVAPADRLWTLNAVRIPRGVDDAKVRQHLLEEFGIEIGGGLGALRGQIWRIGLMGANSQAGNVLFLLTALEQALLAQGVAAGTGAAAAQAVYHADWAPEPPVLAHISLDGVAPSR